MSENKRYYWLKLNEDFFDDDTIQFIEEQENGILYSNFYLKLCLKSLKNEGKLIRLVGNTLIPYDVKSLSKLTNVDIDTVRVAMELFKRIGLIEVLDTGEIYMSQINEMIGSETNRAKGMRALRARQKSEQLEVSQCDASVTTCDEEIEIDNMQGVTMLPNYGNDVSKMLPRDKSIENRDRDKELDKEIENRDRVSSNGKTVTPYADIVNLYNSICLSYPKVTTISDRRKQALKARLNKYTLDDFKKMFELAEASDFLKGSNNRDWSANFDWLIKDSNMAKVLDGNYNNYTRKNGNRKEEVQEHEQQQCDGIEFEKLDRLIDKGETLDSLRETSIEAYNGLPDWFEAYAQHYNTKYNPDGSEKVQM